MLCRYQKKRYINRCVCVCVSYLVVFDSVTPYSPWNSLGQNTGVGSCSLLQDINLGTRHPGMRSQVGLRKHHYEQS